MKNTLIVTKTAQEVINLGWKTLTKELGPVEAARFWMYITHGEGDSVEEYREMWKGKNVEDIHREILKAKKQHRI